MRLIDCYVEFLIGIQRRFAPGAALETLAYDTLRAEVTAGLKTCEQAAQPLALPVSVLEAARFAVVAYVDEAILTSTWTDRKSWQRMTLQREWFHTSNAGVEFYTRLGELGEDDAARVVREVYYLCLALGFRGKYFGEARLPEFTEVKRANLRLLLPDSEALDLKSVTLFPEAYGSAKRGPYGLSGRWNILPWVFGAPAAALVVLFFIYHHVLASTLNGIQALLK